MHGFYKFDGMVHLMHIARFEYDVFIFILTLLTSKHY
jgi:hypothetical protein